MAFNPSGKRQDVSLRLRTQNIKNVRGQTKRLENDNRKMEEQLQELKFAMVKEKEDREINHKIQSAKLEKTDGRVGGGGGGFWKTGEIGSLSSYGKDALNRHIKSELSSAKSKGSKKKVKVLKNEPIVTPQRKKGPGTMSYIAQRGFEKKESKIKGPKCGQCEEKGAHVACIECGEDYCAGCFASFHLKGALKKHRSVPIGSDSVRTPRGVHYRSDIENVAPASAASTFRQTSQASRTSNRDSPTKPPASESSIETDRSEILSSRPMDGPSLLDGCYNEAESAAAFKDAVSAWRKGGAKEGQIMINNYIRPYSPVATPSVNVDSSTSANLDMKPIEITFHNQNLTYAERLLLKQHRRTDVSPFPDKVSTSPTSNRGSRAFYGSSSYREGHRANLSDEERVDFDALYSAVTPQPNISEYRSESRLSIIELNEKQLMKTSPILDQSSSYKVVEQTDDNIYTPINRIQPDSQIQKHDISSSVEAKHPSATKSVTDKRSSRDYDVRYQDISNLDQSAKPRIGSHVKSSKVLGKQSSLENANIGREERPKSAAKTKDQPARPKSRCHTKLGARPPSRASRLAMYGEGHLTKTPSQALKEVAHLASQVADIEYTGGLGDFFTCGVKSDQHQKPAVSSHKKKEQPPKWRVSNKLYQMSARSWRPDSSLAENVSDDQAVDHIDSVGIRYCREFLRTPLDNDTEPDTMTWSWSASIAAESAEEFVQAAKASQKHDRLPSQKSSSKVLKLNPEKQKAPEPMLLNGHSLRSTGSTPCKKVTARSSSRSGSSLSNRPESRSGRDSRMIVMDGEDLSIYDHVGMCPDQDNDDEEALYQLEWELASQTGMLQEDDDGKLSRLSMLDTLDFEDDDSEQPVAIKPSDWHHQDPTSDEKLIEIRDRMRKDEFMEDFEEVEAQILEDEVRALK